MTIQHVSELRHLPNSTWMNATKPNKTIPANPTRLAKNKYKTIQFYEVNAKIWKSGELRVQYAKAFDHRT